MSSTRIAVGMSGGVDSSVAALLLQREGHDVVGATMKIWDDTAPSPVSPAAGHSCYGAGEQRDIEDARRVCDALGIPLHVVDCAKQYREIVLGYFKAEYLAGRTPNPCVLCNPAVKFGVLPSLLLESGIPFDRFATGHYVRAAFDAARRRFTLKRAVDGKKDQTYFLYRLSQEQLSRALFPLGSLRKTEVRAIASDAGLPVHDREESQDFYEGDYADLIEGHEGSGRMVDVHGNVLGTHQGIWRYTIGQRRGLGITSTQPMYVVAIDAGRNEVVLGEKECCLSRELVARDLNWFFGEAPAGPVTAKIRASSKEARCSVTLAGEDEISVRFDEPQSAVTPGQSVVFYDGETVLGGGVIWKAVALS